MPAVSTIRIYGYYKENIVTTPIFKYIIRKRSDKKIIFNRLHKIAAQLNDIDLINIIEILLIYLIFAECLKTSLK